jgi:CsoR family transcriptional regulator, copper-sensing transcriptional repressor
MIKSNKKSYKTLELNLKKAQGMLRKIGSMLEQDAYCGDIAQQINATIGLLKKMNITLLKSHLVCCGGLKLISEDEQQREEFLNEFFRLIDV